MTGRVWMSKILSNNELGNKLGLRTKYFGHEWNPASFAIPVEPDEVYEASKRHVQGFALERANFPEAQAVFDKKHFAKISDIFFAGGFLAVKGAVASVLSRFDLGDGGLIPFTIYEEDLSTAIDTEFFLLNFGARKNTILPEQSRNVVKFVVDRKTGVQIWKVNSWSEDADVALSSSALEGPDLWFEEVVDNKIFMSDGLAHAITEIGMKDVFKLEECRVLEGAQ